MGSLTGNPESKWAIRGWFKWNWWQNGMEWADWTYTMVTEAVGPYIAPIYTADKMYEHHGLELNNESIAYILIDKYDFSIDSPSDFDRLVVTIENIKENRTSLSFDNKLITYKEIHNGEFFITKYSSERFDKFVLKFFDTDGNFKAVGTLLFYQIILAAILSIYFTYQLPIVVERNERNETEVKSRIGPRMPKFSFKKRSKKLKRKEDGK